MTGENTNCMHAQTVVKRPIISAAFAVSPWRKPITSRGSTGTMMPRASMSRSTVMKMKLRAAGRPGRSICLGLLRAAIRSHFFARRSSGEPC